MNKQEEITAEETNMALKTYLNLKGYEHVIVHRGNVKIEPCKPCKGRSKQ